MTDRPIPARRSGHTLLELLAAVAITAILVVLIAQIMASVLGIWSKGKSRIRKNMDARAVLELMVQDLQAMVIRPSRERLGTEWFQRRVEQNLQSEGGYQVGNASWLMFFSAPLDRNLNVAGDVSAVSYRLGYEDPVSGGSGPRIFGIYRTLVPAGTTFDSVFGQSNLYSDYWQAVDTRKQEDFLIANVIKFETTFRAINPDGTAVEITSEPEIRLGDALAVSPSLSTLKAGAKLRSMDISLMLISEEGAKRIRSSGVSMQNVVLGETHIYTRRVQFND